MVEFSRIWEMPNSKTFAIKCIRDFILNGIDEFKSGIILDPFANEHSIKQYIHNMTYICNDLDPEWNCDYTMDALDFLKMYDKNSVDVVLFDPPYSGNQVVQCYKKLDKTVSMQDTNALFWTNFKTEISRIVKPNGLVFSFGWNSNGMGINNGFQLEKVQLVSHGGNHNDTICTMERKDAMQKSDLW